MLQFINICRAKPNWNGWFQYISCCSLSLEDGEQNTDEFPFQYISCCSLSEWYAHIPAFPFSFNTSHVVVYQITFYIYKAESKFQYISCCSLSPNRTFTAQSATVSIHLMLQFIFCSGDLTRMTKTVSIHLMLQFIQLEASKQIKQVEFQYISCCSLSVCDGVRYFIHLRFNTSHVVVYLLGIISAECGLFSFNTSHVVVYHGHSKMVQEREKSFNTSHVVVYQP